MRDYFYALADELNSLITADEVYLCNWHGEETDFIRFNHGKIRQAGQVQQQSLRLDLIQHQRHANVTITLSGDPATDKPRLRQQLEALRQCLPQLPDDPHLLYATEVYSSEHNAASTLPPAQTLVDDILAVGQDFDLVGIIASGSQHSGFANSLGQRNWHCSHSFNFDWSLFRHTDKAVKQRYAGFDWDTTQLQTQMQNAAEQLALLDRPAHKLEPGEYRAYLSPTAVEEIMAMLSWGGFSLRSQRSGETPLRKLVEKSRQLHPSLTLTENTAAGIAADFQSAGFIRPAHVMLVENGQYRDSLVSPRSAAEYAVASNAASASESPLSLDMSAGELATADALAALDNGLYISNLWYLNYSDRNAARITGMTRFATFWVANGKIQAPVEVLRFDDSIYNLLGDKLVASTSERELLLDPGTYDGRSQSSARLPGILVSAMRFTL